jgi:hypothetical protein
MITDKQIHHISLLVGSYMEEPYLEDGVWKLKSKTGESVITLLSTEGMPPEVSLRFELKAKGGFRTWEHYILSRDSGEDVFEFFDDELRHTKTKKTTDYMFDSVSSEDIYDYWSDGDEMEEEAHREEELRVLAKKVVDVISQSSKYRLPHLLGDNPVKLRM